MQIKELAEPTVKTKLVRFRTKSGLSPDLSPDQNPNQFPNQFQQFPNKFVNRIVSMIRSQKKEYVMQKIMELAEKEEHSTKELETVIVKEKGFCGRTAFYDYLRELRHKNLAKIIVKNGRKVLKTC